MQAIADRLARLRERVAVAEQAAGRPAGSVRVLLATKTQPAELIAATLALPEAAGMLRGENRVQELVAKGPALAGLGVPTHLIGPLQSNKINAALRWVDGIESIAGLDLAHAVASRLEPARLLEVMIQVNVSGEPTKSGVATDEAVQLALAVAELPGLAVTGFMTIGANTPDQSVVRSGYAQLAAIRDQALGAGLSTATELSMGMSGDLEAAIAEGATIVRVGTAVFGPRGA
ncbi:MAG: YggS family pyridoxal phosphate-dependent enzyme [Propionibacteriales bacterium]|nr:YggS family pyridoxal phosphate-dependent enzyme [Propionibacteriales bacterium]